MMKAGNKVLLVKSLSLAFHYNTSLEEEEMKQSPFRFQGNNSQQAKKQALKDTEDKKGPGGVLPKNVNKGSSKAKSHIQIRTNRSSSSQRPKGGG